VGVRLALQRDLRDGTLKAPPYFGAPLLLDQTVTETDGKARDVLRNPLKDVDVRTVETALAGALGTLVKQRLTVDIHALDFPAASHRTAKLTLTVSVPVDFGLLREGAEGSGAAEPSDVLPSRHHGAGFRVGMESVRIPGLAEERDHEQGPKARSRHPVAAAVRAAGG